MGVFYFIWIFGPRGRESEGGWLVRKQAYYGEAL